MAAFVFACLRLVAAQTPDAPPASYPAADLDLSLPPVWEIAGSFRTAYGYKENILLSAVRSDDSAFAQAEAEVFWWRLPTERLEATGFINASFTRFFDSRENPHETQVFVHAEANWIAGPTLQAAGSIEGYRLDQVFDLAATSAEQLTARLAVTGGLATLAWRWDVRPHTWLEFKPGVQRDRYRDGSDDNRQHFLRATVGRRWRDERIELTLAGQALRRSYDSRLHYTPSGYPLANTQLGFAQHEGSAQLKIAWGAARRWTTTTSATFTANGDNGPGYFDYDHRHAKQEIAWTRAPWKARLAGRTGRYDYAVQTVGQVGIAAVLPVRWKEESLVQARVQRQMGRALLYTEFLWERSRSNDPLASYRVRTSTVGVDWGF